MKTITNNNSGQSFAALTGKMLMITLTIVLMLSGMMSFAQKAYITNSNGNSVSVVDVASNTITATIFGVSFPEGAAISPDGTMVLVANDGNGTISLINTTSNNITASFSDGNSPNEIVFTPSGDSAYITDNFNNTVEILDLTGYYIANSLTVGDSGTANSGIAISPDGSKVYITNYDSSYISVINTADNSISTIRVSQPASGICISPDGSKLYLTNNSTNTISVVSTATNTVTNTINTGSGPMKICINPAGTRLYVTNYAGFSVSVVNTATNTVISTIPVGTYPDGIDITPDGSVVYAVNSNSNTISVINTTTNTVVNTIAGFNYPYVSGKFIGYLPGTWLGINSPDWNDPSNWLGGAVPTSTSDAQIIVSGLYQPVIGSANAVCKNLTINPGASLTITGSDSLTVSGNLLINGTITPNSGVVTMNGTANQSAGGVGIYSFYNLNLAGSNIVSFTIPTTVTNSLSIATGAKLNLITTTSSTAALFLNGNPQATGTSYGGAGTIAANVNTTYFAAAQGALNVGTCNVYSLSGTTSAGAICKTNPATINLVNTTTSDLPVGTYTVRYNLSLPNIATGNTATMTVTTAGSGSITTSALANGGTTTITITNIANACVSAISNNNTANITVNTNPPVPTGAASQVFCNNSSPTVANLVATGSNINWYSAATGGSPLPGSTALVNGSSYYATQTICGESTTRLHVTASLVNPPSAPSGNATQTFCNGNNPTVANLSATGSSIQWYDAAIGGNLLASSTALVNGTNYYASQTVVCQSTTRLQVTATINQSPTAAITGTTTDCNLVSLTASGGVTYSWSGGSSTNAAANSFTGTGTYTVTVTDNNNCTATTSSPVTINGYSVAPAISSVNGTGFCTGGSITLNTVAGTALSFNGTNQHVAISNLNISPSVIPTLTASVWVKRTSTPNSLISIFSADDGGLDRALMIASNDIYHIYAGRDINTGIVSVLNNVDFISVYWSSTAVIMYQNGVQVFSTTGESASTATHGVHIGSNTTPGFFFTGTIDQLSFWNTSRTTNQLQAEMNSYLTGTEPGLIAYYKFDEGSGTTLTDGTGNGKTGTLINSPTWVTSPVVLGFSSYLWSPDGQTSNSITVSPTTASSYSVSVSNSFGCSITSALTTVTINPLPNGSLSGSTTCIFSPGQLTFTSSVGTGPFTLIISGHTYTNVVSGTPFNVFSNPTTTTVYTLTSITDANGCPTTSGITGATATIIVNPQPNGTLSGGTICFGGTGQLTYTSFAGTGPFSLIISGITYTGVVSGVPFNVNLNPTTTTTYSLTSIIDANTCTRIVTIPATITILPFPSPTFTTSGATSFCNGDSVTLTNTSSTQPAGFALSFNAPQAQHVIIPNLNISPATIPTLTASAWVERTGALNSYEAIFSNDDGGFDRALTVFTDGNYHIFAGRDINTGVASVLNSLDFMSVSWSSSAVTMYKNGVQVFTTTGESASSGIHGAAIGSNAMNQLYFPGIIDQVSFWSTARTSNQLQSEMNTYLTGSETGLVAYYKFDEGAGLTTADGTGNGRTGTVINSPTWITSPIPAVYSGYLWSPGGQTTSSITVSPSTTTNYTLNITNFNGCSATSAATTVTVYPVPDGTLTGNSFCNAGVGQLTFNSSTGTGPFTLVINGNTYTNIMSGTPINVSPNPTSTTTYTLTYISDTSSCPNINRITGATATIAINPYPNGSLTGNLLCSGGIGQLVFNSSIGTGPFSLIINGTTYSGVVSGIPFNANPNPTTTSNYTLTSITDANTCPTTSGINGASATITLIPLPNGSLSGNTVCSGGSGQLTFTSSVGTGPFNLIINGTTYSGVGSGTSFNVNPSPTTTTNYTLTSITDANNCPTTSGITGASATINVNPKPNGSLSANTICFGGLGQLTFTSTTGTGPFTLVINGTTYTNVVSGTPFNANPNPVNSTNYTLTSITDANSCPTTSGITGATARININPLPNGSLTGNSICPGGIGKLTFTSSVGTGPFSLVINGTTYSGVVSGAPFNANPNPATTTNYTLTSINDAITCSNTSSISGPNAAIVVAPLPSPTITSSGATTFCNGNSVTLYPGVIYGHALSFSGSNQHVAISNLDISPAAIPTLTASAWVKRTGGISSYQAIYSNDDGGFDRALTIYIDGNYHIFAGRDINTGIVSTINSWDFMTVYWSSTVVTLFKNGVQVFTTTGESASSGTHGTTIGSNTLPTLFFPGVIDQVSFWNTSRTTTQLQTEMNTYLTGTETGLVAFYNFDEGSGNYTVDGSGHGKTGTLLSSPTWVVSMNAISYSSLVWSPGGQTSSAITVNPSSSTSYTVNVTNSFGCSATSATTAVTVNPLPNGSLSGNTICAGAAGKLTFTSSVGTGPFALVINGTTYTGIVSGVPFNASPNPTGTTNYTLTSITDANTCPTTSGITGANATITVNLIPAVPTGAATQTFCSGTNPTIVNLTVTGNNILWYDAPSAGNLLPNTTALVNGTSYYASQSANSCESTTRFQVTATVNVTPSVPTGSASQVFCTSSNATIASLAITGNNILWYDAANAGNLLATSTTLVDGTSYYASEMTNGCESLTKLQITATVNTNPTAGITTHSDVSCYNSGDGALTVTAFGGSGSGYSYLWNPTNSTSNSVNGLSPNTYSVLITDGNQCTATASATITQPNLLTASSNSGTINCYGQSTSVTINASGGTTNYTGTGTITNVGAGTYTYTVSDAHGCSATTSITISQPVLGTFTSSNVNLLCNGINTGSISVSTLTGGTSSMTYSNNGGATYQSSNSFTGLAAGTYSIEVTYGSGCTSTFNTTITQPSAITYTTVVSNNSSCTTAITGSISVSATGGTGVKTYSKNNGSTYQGAALFSSLTNGTYSIKVKDGNGCLSSTSSTVITSNPGISFTTSVIDATCANANGKITVTATGGAGAFNYSKNSGTTYQASNMFNLLLPGTYSLKVKDPLGCVSTLTSVYVGDNTSGCRTMEDNAISTPTAFSIYPNPASDAATIAFSSDKTENYTISMIDIMGRNVLQFALTSTIGENQYQMNLSAIAKGIYMVILQNSDGARQKKIVVE